MDKTCWNDKRAAILSLTLIVSKSQCWPRFMYSYGVTMRQWVKLRSYSIIINSTSNYITKKYSTDRTLALLYTIWKFALTCSVFWALSYFISYKTGVVNFNDVFKHGMRNHIRYCSNSYLTSKKNCWRLWVSLIRPETDLDFKSASRNHADVNKQIRQIQTRFHVNKIELWICFY